MHIKTPSRRRARSVIRGERAPTKFNRDGKPQNGRPGYTPEHIKAYLMEREVIPIGQRSSVLEFRKRTA
ncbi:MAG: hypothetical protein R2747_13520 [Pyrinomonadaceae bacterium]